MKHIMTSFLAIGSIVFPFASYSKDYKVSAQAVDSLGTPESFVTWRVFCLPDTVKPIKGAVTGEDGLIESRLSSVGDYRLELIGMETDPFSRNFSITDENPDFNFGKIILKPRNNELSELTVTAQRPLVVKEIDRIGYDVKADTDAPTSTLSEILRKVPMVTVEDDGTIKVNGKTDFKIYKNGRPNSSYSKNAKDIFKAIPASSIRKVEVITDPGAREDAEGVGSILNIVTDTETAVKGVVGSISAGVSTTSTTPNPNGYISTQIGKVTVSANGGYYNYTTKNSEYSSETDGIYQSTGNNLRSSNRGSSKGHGSYGGIEASFELDTLNLFTLEGDIYSGNDNSTGYTFNELISPTGAHIYKYNQSTATPLSNYLGFSGSFNYQRSTRLKGETITFSYQASVNNSKNESEERYYDLVNPPMDYTGIDQNSNLKFSEHTFQVDWMRPLNDKMKLDVGGKYIRRNNHALTSNDYVGTDRNSSEDFVHRTDVGAIYADYRATLGKFGARAGLRYELSRLSAEYRLGNEHDFGSNLSDWAPNLACNWQINDANTLKISYNRRISRPNIYSLDPTVYETPVSTSQGNPELKSSNTDRFTLNYSLIKPKFNMDANLMFSSSNDMVGRIVKVIDEHTYSTNGNINHYRSYGMSYYCQWSPFPKTSLMMNLWCDYSRYRYVYENLSEGRWSFNPYIMVAQRIPWDIQLRAYASYWSGGIGSVYSYSTRPLSSTYYGLTCQRSFLKENRLTVMLSTTNPFGPSSVESRSYNVNSDYISKSVRKSYHRISFGIRISYRFGSLQTYVKKTAATISNDDVQGSGSGNSGGSSGGNSNR